MPDDRYHHQSPLWAVDFGAESIMPPTSCNETHGAGDLTVTVHGSVLITVLIWPVMAWTGSAASVAAVALAMACIRAARGSRLTYRRICRPADGDRHAGPPDRRAP